MGAAERQDADRRHPGARLGCSGDADLFGAHGCIARGVPGEREGHQAATGGLFDAHFDVTDAFKRIAPGVRSPYESSLLVGPSLQPRPLPQMHIDFAPLFGANQPALRSKTFVVFGFGILGVLTDGVARGAVPVDMVVRST